MKTKDKDNYYNDEDEINFDKLKNFRKFNSNIKSNTQSKDHNIRYANSDKNYFNNIFFMVIGYKFTRGNRPRSSVCQTLY